MKTKRRKNNLFNYAVVVFLVASCSIDDEDRCLDGYVWLEDQRLCVEEGYEKSTETDDEIDSSVETDSGDDDTSDADDSSKEQQTGLGQECFSSDDCDFEDAKLCLLNPLAPNDPGICTIEGCQIDDCTGHYSCCDCSQVTMMQLDFDEPVCVPDSRVAMISVAGCICN